MSTTQPHEICVYIKGMTCGHCVNTVTTALKKLPGIDPSSVTVDLDTGQARMTVQIGTDTGSAQELVIETVNDLGYEASAATATASNDGTHKTTIATSTLVHGTLTISGMTCGHCTKTIHNALSQLPDVIPDSIHVSLDQGVASLLFSQPNPRMNADRLAETIEDLGYDVESVRLRRTDEPQSEEEEEEEQNGIAIEIKTVSLSISGMTCSHCTRSVTHALQSLPGVVGESVQVDLGKRTAAFSYHGDDITTELIVQTVEDLGYDVVGRPRFGKSVGMPPVTAASVEEGGASNPAGLRKVVMRVLGMTCQSCVAAVTHALEFGVPNIQRGSIRVDLETEMAMFICKDPDAALIRQVVEDRGYDLENIQIIHNLVQPAVIAAATQETASRRTRSITSDSVVSLGAITVETPVIAVPKKVTMQISGMTCASCVRTIEQGLAALPSVTSDSVKVNLLTGGGSFEVQGDVLNETQIINAITRMGYSASNVSILAEQQTASTPATYQVDMIVSGMYCMNCVDKVRQALSELPGSRSDTVKVNLESGRTSFQYSSHALSRKRITDTIMQLGFMADSVDIAKIFSGEDERSDEEKAKNNMAVTRLSVTGMTCSSCVANIERAMMKQSGVSSCQVNLLAKSAVIHHNPSVVGARALSNMIEQLGYKAEPQTDNATNALNDQREAMRATMQKEMDLLKRRFLWSLLFAIPIIIIDMIFMMALPEHNPVRMAFMKSIVPGLSIADLISFLLATPVQFLLGWPFYVKSYRSLRYARTANMETLVAMGTSVAYAASVGRIIAAIIKQEEDHSMNFFETAVLLITFIHLGKWLEALAKGKTAETITKLMDLQPDKAILVEIQTKTGNDDETSIGDSSHADYKKNVNVIEYEHVQEVMAEREIDIKEIQVGDILKVNAGARIPCDGKIWRGATSTDESMITGESVPVSKKESDDVITATINLTSSIYIRAIRVGSDTTLSRIIQLVQDAQASPKAPIEHFADKISSVFVPIVIALAIITFIIWEVVSVYDLYPEEWVGESGDKTTFALMLAVTVLVIACPCGLGLASPTAVMVGTGVAAQYGVLVKGGGYALEMASRITTIAFDKTGTLTLGKPVVTNSWTAPAIGSSSSSTEDDETQRQNAIWKVLGRVTSASNHPLSKAIEKRAKINLGARGDEADDDSESNCSSSDEQAHTGRDFFEGVALKNAKEVAGRGVMATMTLSPEMARLVWPSRHATPENTEQQERAVNVFLGNQEWMDENRARYANVRQAQQCQDQLVQWQNKGQSIVIMSISPVTSPGEEKLHTDGCNNDCACTVCRCSTGSVCCSTSRTMMMAQVAVADVVRPEAKDVVQQLRKQGLEVWMITGDNERTGRVIADQLSIDSDCVLAGVKPEQKADKIRNLQRRGGLERRNRLKFWKQHASTLVQPVVAMVGDGINDSPSLAQADVGISVGSATDVAMEAASIVLIRNNLWDLLIMHDISRAVVRRIRINFLWAFIYNVVAIPIAAGILYPGTGHGLPPYIAGIAMVASSISVVCSSLMLRFYKAPKKFLKQ